MDEYLTEYIGKRVLLMCSQGFFYHGIIEAVNDTAVQLKNPSIVYDTGEAKNKEYALAERMHTTRWNVAISSIESFGDSK